VTNADMSNPTAVARFAAAVGCALVLDLDFFARAAGTFGRGRLDPVNFGA